MTAGKKNEFSWSKSRDEVFRLCPRRYYFDYYASWGGWDEGAPPRTRELYILKKLKTRPMWIGDIVHRAVQRSLDNLARGLPVLGVDRVVEITLNLMRNEFRSSRRGNYRTSRDLGLFEHEYNLAVPDEEWRAAADAVETCLRHFYASDLFARLLKLPRDKFLEVETLSSFNLESTRCWVILDAAWREERGLTIADWKTGRSEPGGYELQLTGYALYASGRWGAEPADITLLEYNLFHDRSHRYQVDRGTVERTTSYILGSIADMKTVLAEAGGNVPLPEERFTKVVKREICSQCNYLKLCRPDLG